MMALVLVLLFCWTEEAAAQRVKVGNAVAVTKTRDTHTVVWRALEDGSLTTSGLTLIEYEALAGINAAPPPKLNLPANRTWEFVSASRNAEFSTPSGRLEPGNIYTIRETIFVILGVEDEVVRLDAKDYTVTGAGGPMMRIVPDPPGIEVNNGEVHKK